MKMPHWILKIIRREPAKTNIPSRSVREIFLEYLKRPSIEGFQCLRQQVAASDRYAPYSNELDILVAALGAGHPQSAIDLFWRSFPNLLLSPLAHFILSQAYLDLEMETIRSGHGGRRRPADLLCLFACGKSVCVSHRRGSLPIGRAEKTQNAQAGTVSHHSHG